MATEELTPESLAELKRLSTSLPGVIAFLRENFHNDGAEGESVHRLCAIADYVPALLSAVESHAAAARHNAAVAELWIQAAKIAGGRAAQAGVPMPDLPDNPTAEDGDRFTWSVLDQPTISYVAALVRGIDPRAGLALRILLDRLKHYDGVLPEWRQKRLHEVPR